MKDQQIKLLINILLDKNAREDERDDAAIDLREYPDPKVIEALVHVASNVEEDPTIRDNCAESLATIFIEMNRFDVEGFIKLTPFAQKIVFCFVMAHKPQLIAKEIQEEFKNQM